jgi:hypothetical protein
VMFDRTETNLLSGSSSGVLKCYDLAKWKGECTLLSVLRSIKGDSTPFHDSHAVSRSIPAHRSAVTAMDWHPLNAMLAASGGDDCTIKVRGRRRRRGETDVGLHCGVCCLCRCGTYGQKWSTLHILDMNLPSQSFSFPRMENGLPLVSIDMELLLWELTASCDGAVGRKLVPGRGGVPGSVWWRTCNVTLLLWCVLQQVVKMERSFSGICSVASRSAALTVTAALSPALTSTPRTIFLSQAAPMGLCAPSIWRQCLFRVCRVLSQEESALCATSQVGRTSWPQVVAVFDPGLSLLQMRLLRV